MKKSEKDILERLIKQKKIDFLDFGASKAASIKFGIEKLSGSRGLGIDLDPKRVKKMNDEGLDCKVGDITNLKISKNSVRFVKMVHILEHLPNVELAEKSINCAVKAASEFVVISGPFFDEDMYLKSNELKLEWADYPEHTLAFKVSDLINIVDKTGVDYEIYLRHPIHDSSNEFVLPLNAPAGTHGYSTLKGLKKKNVKFDRNIWTDFVCYILINEPDNWNYISNAYKNQVLYVKKRNNKKTVVSEEVLTVLAEKTEEIEKLNEVANRRGIRISKLEKELNSTRSLLNKKTSYIKQFIRKLISVNGR